MYEYDFLPFVVYVLVHYAAEFFQLHVEHVFVRQSGCGVEQFVDMQVYFDDFAFLMAAGVFGDRLFRRFVGRFFLAHGLFEHSAVDYHRALRHVVFHDVEGYHRLVEIHVFVEAVHFVEFGGIHSEFHGGRVLQLEFFALLESDVLHAYAFQFREVVVRQFFQQYLHIRLYDSVVAGCPVAVAAA